MLPGTSTGWPTALRSSGRSAWPGPNARVAPLRWTHRFLGWPATRCDLEFREIVGDVEDEVESEISRCGPQCRRERLPSFVREDVPVRPCEVRCRRHRTEVGPPFSRNGRDTGELTIGHRDAVPSHRGTHQLELILAGLMTESSAPAVDHHGERAGSEPEGLRRAGVEDAIDDLDLEEVIPGAERAKLASSSLPRFG